MARDNFHFQHLKSKFDTKYHAFSENSTTRIFQSMEITKVISINRVKDKGKIMKKTNKLESADFDIFCRVGYGY